MMFTKKEKPKVNSNESNKRSPFFQAKLKVGKPGDKYEVEADKMADKVVNNESTSNTVQKKEGEEEVQQKPLASQISPLIQKMETSEEEPVQKMEEEESVQKMEEEESVQKMEEEEPVQKMEEEESVQKMEEEEPVQKMEEEESVQKMEEEEPIQQKEEEEVQAKSKNSNNNSSSIEGKLRNGSGGTKMDNHTKNEMESGFGADFSKVNIHNDNEAAQMSQDVGAQAFTHGNDVYFNQGKYNPNSKEGKHLLAHELTHTIQQKGMIQKKEASNNIISNTSNNIQGGFFSNVWNGVKSVGRSVANAVSSGVNAIGGVIGTAWNKATTFLGNGATWVLNGLKTLGTATLNWLVNAGSKVWKAIKWFGNKAWEGIKWLGGFLWEKLVVLGSNVWSFISNIPFRLWRIIVHGWEAIKGTLSWAWTGLKGGAKHIWKAIVGTFNWLEEGIEGGIKWLLRGVVGGAQWALDFIQAPSLSKLWNGLVGSIGWIKNGVKGLLKWGWEGIKGIAIWAYEGVKGFASWLWDGFVSGVTWIGTLIMHLLDFFGIGEFLQIIWGLVFRLRPLTQAEIAASQMVHPPGMIPYNLIRVDDNSLISMIGGAPVTTMHIIHVPSGGILLSTMVHELTHVAQYEHVGSVYMPQAIHAQVTYGRSGGQGSGSAYDYEREGSLATLRAAGKKFSDFNRESQAELVQDYYNLLVGGGSTTNHQPFINDMQSGDF